jgi:MFS family permease
LLAGGAMTLTFAVGGRSLPDEVRTAAFGAVAGAGQIGASVSPVLAGFLARWSSLGSIFVLDAVLYAFILVWSWWALPAAGAESSRLTTSWPRLRAAPATGASVQPHGPGEADCASHSAQRS